MTCRFLPRRNGEAIRLEVVCHRDEDPSLASVNRNACDSFRLLGSLRACVMGILPSSTTMVGSINAIWRSSHSRLQVSKTPGGPQATLNLRLSRPLKVHLRASRCRSPSFWAIKRPFCVYLSMLLPFHSAPNCSLYQAMADDGWLSFS
jgi:hypothetical protein